MNKILLTTGSFPFWEPLGGTEDRVRAGREKLKPLQWVQVGLIGTSARELELNNDQVPGK